jgi:hypothetical protein
LPFDHLKQGVRNSLEEMKNLEKDMVNAASMKLLPPKGKHKNQLLLALPALVMQANATNASKKSMAFYTDSGPIGTNNQNVQRVSPLIGSRTLRANLATWTDSSRVLEA